MGNISIIITCYREGELIREAVNSVLSQSLLPQEIIIVNDASTDQPTIAVCQDLELNELNQELKCPINVIWREVNGGSSVARNTGFSEAKGEILVPLDADDILPVDALKLISQAFSNDSELSFVYGSYMRLDRTNSIMKINPDDISLGVMLRAKRLSLSSNWKLLGTTPLKRSLWQSLGGYDPNFGVKDLHDVEFWMRAIASGVKYTNIPEPIYIWRKYLGSNSRLVTPMAWYQIAEKYWDIYNAVGLEYRAYELLLLGSKWLNQSEDIRTYTHKLWQSLRSGQIHFSTLVAIAIPPQVLRFLANWHRR
ncbi:glycosyl transferase [Synechococcus sp. PCC 7502]|uniref:glycosyltransferase family 2 protein n=1 Tax=Synechococcus sp. PCC 7502 TaxID=1173263 RepID=UPI00029F82B5|nr:glycosyltransferase family 2 protein [Synechococcus sp. PCC 7502]AFY75204.1 glycosyl transferase [Synechococcus sp. PCC 7502]